MTPYKNFISKLVKAIGLFLVLIPSFLINSEETLPELGDASSSAISLSSEYKLGRLE